MALQFDRSQRALMFNGQTSGSPKKLVNFMNEDSIQTGGDGGTITFSWPSIMESQKYNPSFFEGSCSLF